MRDVWLSRWLRCALPVMLLACLAWLGLAPTNVALGKPVSVSTNASHTPAPPMDEDTFYRVVDGREREQPFAVHTELEVAPWVQVDLGKPYRIQRVVAYPRTDCCFADDQLPLVVELSNDGRLFEVVAKQTTPATVDFPWRFAIRGKSARYVRLSTDSKEPHRIVIGELQVYGR